MSVIDGTWHKSSYSSTTGGECVEVADTNGGGAAVRDTRNREAGFLAFPGAEWRAFLGDLKAGRL